MWEMNSKNFKVLVERRWKDLIYFYVHENLVLQSYVTDAEEEYASLSLSPFDFLVLSWSRNISSLVILFSSYLSASIRIMWIMQQTNYY